MVRKTPSERRKNSLQRPPPIYYHLHNGHRSDRYGMIYFVNNLADDSPWNETQGGGENARKILVDARLIEPTKETDTTGPISESWRSMNAELLACDDRPSRTIRNAVPSEHNVIGLSISTGDCQSVLEPIDRWYFFFFRLVFVFFLLLQVGFVVIRFTFSRFFCFSENMECHKGEDRGIIELIVIICSN